MEVYRIEIPYRFPSFNQYINDCRKNKFAGAQAKKKIESDIGWYINKIPIFENPIEIHFLWVEENKRRDLDNVFYAKKFILDAMVKLGKLKDDNRKFVLGFSDSIAYDKESKVILTIKEVKR
jgi:Holliday junction resolvase RusA-like endonuclease